MTSFYDRVKDNEKFRDFVLPMEELGLIRDATIFIHKTGLLLFSEGYLHPPGKLICNIIYIPDPEGKKEIFGLPYRSIIKQDQDGEEAWRVIEKDWIELVISDWAAPDDPGGPIGQGQHRTVTADQ